MRRNHRSRPSARTGLRLVSGPRESDLVGVQEDGALPLPRPRCRPDTVQREHEARTWLVEHKPVTVHRLQIAQPASEILRPCARDSLAEDDSVRADGLDPAPGSNRPWQRRTPTPAGSLPFSTSACRAPSSTWILPATGLPRRSRLERRLAAIVRRRSRPARLCGKDGPSSSSPCPPAITVGIPAALAPCAATTLLPISPRPSSVPTPISASPADSAWAGARLRSPGSASNTLLRPRQEEERPRANKDCDLGHEGIVLPDMHWSVAVASFSLTTGTAPSRKSSAKAWRAST